MSDWRTIDYYMSQSNKQPQQSQQPHYDIFKGVDQPPKQTQPMRPCCPKCKAGVAEGDRYCWSCGEPLTDVKSGILLDLERAKRDKEEQSLLMVAAAFAVGGILAGRDADTMLMALLNTLLYGGGVLLVGGALWLILYVAHQVFTDGREGRYGIKAIFCIVVAVAAAVISFLW